MNSVARREIPFGRPMIGDEERAAVLKVLESPQLVHGPAAKAFESAFAASLGAAAYATRIARDWNTKDAASGYVGYVLRFDVEAEYVRRFEPQRVGGAGIDELWVPAEQLNEFNDHIVGRITVVAEHHGAAP